MLDKMKDNSRNVLYEEKSEKERKGANKAREGPAKIDII